MLAAMRGMKAQGGWGVVHTEHVSINPTSDILGEIVLTLWDDGDIPPLARTADAIHEHGALAGIQLAHASYYNANRSSREVGMGPDARPVAAYDPVQIRAMDRRDIKDLLGWQRDASRRALAAGFDIINVDANFSTTAFQFLSPRSQRTDEYGGSIKNRARLLKELVEVTRESVKEQCAVTIRIIVDEAMGEGGLIASEDGLVVIEYLDELTDLWDLLIGTWADDSPTSRFAKEGNHEPLTAPFREVTRKPIVGVGRFTSPDAMVSQIKRGVLDLIGATRPSIADPFLPKKIEEGRIEDIRECIGCNICVSTHLTISPIRCTQNPTMGEEFRRGWHPEELPAKGSDANVLIVGAGPAGLECARALGQRGYEVVLAEATTEIGGRVTRESQLPGLAEWARVRDWREGQLIKLPNVQIYRDSRLDAEQVLEYGFGHVVIATGATWRDDGVGRINTLRIPGTEERGIHTPDTLMNGALPDGPVVVFDDDHYYLGNVLAEKLVQAGREVTLVTPASDIAAWSQMTLEFKFIIERMLSLGIRMVTHHNLTRVSADSVRIQNVLDGSEEELQAQGLVLVTSRSSDDQLYQNLRQDDERLEMSGIRSVTAIGDCRAPGAIVHAVYAGHRYARELDVDPDSLVVRWDRTRVD